jgi:hypothetical protein
MAKAYDRARTREYVARCDRDDKGVPLPDHTVFTLGWLSVFDFTAIEEQFSKDPDAPNAFPKLVEIVRRCLRGWKNFKMFDGSEAPFEKGPDGLPTVETVQRIGPRELMELAQNCDGQEKLTPDDVGKS